MERLHGATIANATSKAMPESGLGSLPPLIATSVVRGSQQGDSHGGVFLIDPLSQSVHQLLDWNTADIDWQGRGWDRGLRGIAFYEDHIYIAASDELFVYDQAFELVRSHRNRYLKHCHEISVFRDTLYVTSTGFDSILAFDLKQQHFAWGLQVAKYDGQWQARRFDPRTQSGPPLQNRLHINNVVCDERSLCFSGLRTRGIVSLGSDARLTQQVELPDGVHNARLHRDGVVFNDTQADRLRFAGRDGIQRAFPYPAYPAEDLKNLDVDNTHIARPGFGRGLCIINDSLIASGSSPSTVTVFDLQSGKTVFSVNFSMDVRNAIHGLEVWPYSLPGVCQ